jgi:hypothetical protein
MGAFIASILGGEGVVEEGLEEVLGLAQRLALHRAQPPVPLICQNVSHGG